MAKKTTDKQVLKYFRGKPEELRKFFDAFEELVPEFTWRVIVPYIFSRVEVAKHSTIYCAIVKLHKTDSDLTWQLVNDDHMSRGRFRELFKIVVGKDIPDALLAK